MCQTRRIIYYAHALPKGTLITHTDLCDLLWRGREDGGPEDYKEVLTSLVWKVNQKLHGERLAADSNGGFNAGWRLVRHADF